MNNQYLKTLFVIKQLILILKFQYQILFFSNFFIKVIQQLYILIEQDIGYDIFNSGNKLKKNLFKFNCFDDAIPNQFIINKIYKESINETNFIVIKGQFFDDLKFEIYNLEIFLIYPERSVNCFIKSTSKYIQAYIYCNIGKTNFKEILINNQIIYSKNCKESLLLINKEIYYQNYQIIDNDIIKQKNSSLIKTIQKIDYIIYIILLIFLNIKIKLI